MRVNDRHARDAQRNREAVWVWQGRQCCRSRIRSGTLLHEDRQRHAEQSTIRSGTLLHEDPDAVKYAQARHHHWQRIFVSALAHQGVAALDPQDAEELSWNLADASAARSTWSDVHAALVGELTHRGVGEDHGTPAVRSLTDVLLHAIQKDPEPPVGTYTASARGWLARRREDRANWHGRWFTLEPWGQDLKADHQVLRAVLGALRPWATQLQTDLPMASRGQWPPDVAAAADHLLAASPRHRGDTAEYATTGWLPAADEETWAAYATLAPYALGSDVLSERASAFISIDDGGTSVALRLDAEQHARVLTVLQVRHLRHLG